MAELDLKTRRLVMFTIVAFLASLTLGSVLTQAYTGLLTETRSDALMTTLSSHQNNDGSFPSFLSLPNETGDAYQTAYVLAIGNMLGRLDKVNLAKAENYIIAKQNLTSSGKTIWGWPLKQLYENSNVSSGDLGGVYFILNTLGPLNMIDRINKTAAVDFALGRYNSTDGSFYEPLVYVKVPSGGVVPFAPMWFPLEFKGDSILTAYSTSNMISTFLGVSVLSMLGELSRINTTLTRSWILNSMGPNGAFGPYPGSSTSLSNPFNVDQDGTGLAFTFAAVSALQTLGSLQRGTLNATKIQQYVLSCQDILPPQNQITRFIAYPDDRLDNFVHYSYYALATLRKLGAFDNDVALKVTNYLLNYLQRPLLAFNDSWPLPLRSGSDYGFFNEFPPLLETYFSVLILNVTGNLLKMGQLTPIVPEAWTHMLIISILATGIFATGLLIYAATRKKSQLPQTDLDSTTEIRAPPSD